MPRRRDVMPGLDATSSAGAGGTPEQDDLSSKGTTFARVAVTGDNGHQGLLSKQWRQICPWCSLAARGGSLPPRSAMAAPKKPTEHLLTPADVAALVFVDPKTVSRWASKGRIASKRTPGGHRRFRSSDVQALMFEVLSNGALRAEVISRRDNGDPTPVMPVGRSRTDSAAGPRATCDTGFSAAESTADAVVAEAVAIVLETQARAAAEAVLEAATSIAAAAERAASAAAKARHARTFAAAEAAHVIVGEAALAAAAMRLLTTVQAARLAAAQAKRLVGSPGAEAQTSPVAERTAATMQAADPATADSALAQSRHPWEIPL